jgi:hypothetical protein
MKESDKGMLLLVLIVGGLLMMKKRKPDYESTRHLGRYGQPNSPYTMGVDGEMINMASVGKPAKGGIFNALNPVNSGLTASNQKSAQQIREARAAEFKYMMSLPEAERNAELAKRGLTPKL